MSALKKKPARAATRSKKKPAKVAKAAAQAARKPAKPVARKAAPVRRPAVKPVGLKAKPRSAKVAPAAAPVTFQLPLMPAHLVAAVKALDDKKAVDLRVLQLGQLSSVADFLVVATGNSEPHLRALRIELERVVEAAGSRTRTEAHKDSGWSVVDAFDVVFHLFRADTRRSYGLESLWKDGLDIPVAAILKA